MPEVRILVVEDEGIIARDLQNRLIRLGYEVPATAFTGAEAIAMATALGPQLILMDINLHGDMDGIEVATRIRADLDIPVVFVTAHADDAVVNRAKLAQPYGYILKPYNEKELHSVIEIALYKAAMERKLRESEARYRTIVETAQEGIWTLDTEHRTTFANRRLAEMFGYSGEEMLGKPVFEFIHEADLQPAEASLTRVRQGLNEQLDFRFRRRDGADLWAIVSANPLLDASGQYAGALVMVIDITERRHAEETLRRSEERLRQAQKMEAVGLLSGGIAHDFNNLLTAIIGFSGLALSNLQADDPQRVYIQEIAEAGERAATLTSQLLTLSRQQVLKLEILDLNQVVSDMERLLKRIIGEDVEVVSIKAPELGEIRADRGGLEQIIMNLCVNARDAMPGGGRLTITTSNVKQAAALPRVPGTDAPSGYVLLTVNDDGVGIDAETQAHIFEPFFTTKDVGKGTGLGLSTVYGIVQQSGGRIDVYSEIGHGTSFKIYLPRVSGEAARSSEVHGSEKHPTGSETILLVEDDPSVRAFAQEVLISQGYVVLEASHGKEALARVADQPGPIDLLVTDVIMPEMTGVELARNLSASLPNLRVLYMSGYPGQLSASHGIFTEASYLSKPFTPSSLAQKVRKVLDQPAEKVA